MIVGKRKIKNSNRFNELFPRAIGRVEKVKSSAKLSDTIDLIKKVVRSTSWQTERLAAFVKADSFKQTCRNLWEFAYNHIQYKPDTMGIEEIRTPARSWSDKITGIDCDCFSTLIGATLYTLRIPFFFRITKYKSKDFEHIYPIAMIGNKQIILDAVIDQFNYEVPYTEKKDIKMELHTLNGIDARSILDEVDDEKVGFSTDLSIDATDLFGENLSGLDGKKEREARQAKRKAKRDQKIAEKGTLKDRVKAKIKKGVDVLSKVNPATVLLRAGILASMKLNVFKIASKLRFAYWTEEEARRRNMDLNKFNELQRIREHVEQTFHKAGGDPKKLKKAILSGKGNRNRMVQLSGLGAIIDMPSDEDDLRTILGEELYSFDFEDGSINGLGSVALGTAISAASGVMAVIKKILGKLGGLFKRGSSEAQQMEIQDNTDNEEEKQRKFSVRNLFQNMKKKSQERKQRRAQRKSGDQGVTEEIMPEDEFLPENIDDILDSEAEFDQGDITSKQSDKTQDNTTTDEQEPSEDKEKDEEEKGFWANNWKWIVPVGSAVVIGGTALGVHLHKKKKAKENEAVNGLGAVKKNTKKATKKSRKKGTKRTGSKPKSKVMAVQLIP